MKKTAFLIVASSMLFACGTQPTSAPKQIEKKVVAVQPSLTISNASVTKNDGQNLDVTVTANNNTSNAIFIQSSDFALSNDSTTLSPTSQSNVPTQIPANSKTNITLDFNVKGQLSGTANPKLGFQPSGNQPEQFQSLGSVKIPVPQNTESKPSSSSTSKPAQPINVTIVQRPTVRYVYTDSPSDDIAQDVAFINQRLAGDGYIVNPYPDAQVPDGFGGTLYAWVVRNEGDGMSEQILFFINNHYLGTDTDRMHGPTTVVPDGTGTILATYAHYLPGDPNSSPSGIPYVCSFFWNGHRIIPSDVWVLNQIDQTRN